MGHAIVMHRTGDVDVLEWTSVADPSPRPGELVVAHAAVALNFVDVYHRTGTYPMALPGVPGLEAAGVVATVGESVEGFAPGDRIAYTMLPGAYCERRAIPADRAIRLPADIDFRTAAAVLSKGLTARYLLHDIRPVVTNDVVLVHAAAGGVGSLLCQWASALGATVIGTVSTEEKAVLARENGCADVVVGGYDTVSARIEEVAGRKADFVFDSIGRDSFAESIDSLRPRGMLVCFGEASGPVDPVPLETLQRKGSLVVTRPTLVDFIGTPSDLAAAAQGLFDAVRDGIIRPDVRQVYALRDAAIAHRDLEARRTSGATVLEVGAA
jgi:NADPH2:quinone reductase